MKSIYDLYGQNTQVKKGKLVATMTVQDFDKQEANSSSNVGKIALENCFISCSQKKKHKWTVITSTVLASLELCNYIL
jgi:hypothetical protein